MTRVSVVLKNQQNPAYQGAQIGLDQVAAQHGVEVTYHVPQVPDSINEQRAMLADLIDQRPDAILVVPAHAERLDDLFARIDGESIPLVTFVGKPASDRGICNVGSDDYQMCYDLGQLLAEHLGRGRVMIIDGNPNSTNFIQRHDGFRDAIAHHGGPEVVGSRIGNYLRGPGYEVMKELLDEHGVPDGLCVANDDMGIGALKAMRERDVKFPVVSANAVPEGVQCVQAGDFLATAAFDAMSMACLAMMAALRHLDGEEVPARIVLPTQIVDADNLDRWNLPYEQRPLPVWDDLVAK